MVNTNRFKLVVEMGKAFKATVVVVYVLLVAVLAVATFVERAQGTAFVERNIYHSYWFCSLWGVLALATVAACIRYRWWLTKLPVLILHGSFLVILAGALTTFATGKKGYVHLAVGSETASFVEQGSRSLQPLPFTLMLDSFRVEHYPGTEAPADYVSYVRFRPHGEGDTAETDSTRRPTTKRAAAVGSLSTTTRGASA